MPASVKRLEFRIPISPTEAFFAQVRFFNFALRRLGAPYDQARLLIVVGDHCDIDAVRRENRWSERFNIVWERVPDEICSEFGMWGTANWRLNIPAGDADIICLSDADTVLLRDIDPLLADFPIVKPTLRGHMAHMPPPSNGTDAPVGYSPEFWPWLFDQFEIHRPAETHHYSMDANKILPKAPAYFNLGFVAMNASALTIFDTQIIEAERQIKALTQSHMRCQIAVTIMAYRAAMDIGTIPAAYNAANDLGHLETNGLKAEDIRVLHYLRNDEIDRSTILLPDILDQFLLRELKNPANRAFQNLARDYRDSLI
jgi:hypothetical protein